MPDHCCVFGCSNRRGEKTRKLGISFHRFPVKKHQRAAWIRAVGRANWTAGPFHRLCSAHFVSGWPSEDTKDVDYYPSVDMKGKSRDSGPSRRQERISRWEMVKIFESAVGAHQENEVCFMQESLRRHDYVCAAPQECEDPPTYEDKGTQTEWDPCSEICDLKEELTLSKTKLRQRTWSIDKIRDNDKATKFYTGLPTFTVFLWLFNFLKPKAERMNYSGDKLIDRKNTRRLAMPLIDQFLAVMLRLKVGLFLQDVADRFDISTSLMSRTFTTWLSLMEKELERLNPCPGRDIIQQSLPPQFKNFPNIRFIIDCTEVFIERASSLVAQNLTFSNYKHHTTVKFLVAITPTGAFNFVSQGWGGRTSDRHITSECGFLDLVEEGDLVLADKGFTIGDLLAKKKAYLNIPPFKRTEQFSVQEIQETLKIAEVRIHVERAIGRAKRFHILDPVVPLSLHTTVSSIFRVCCFLSNLDKPLVT